MFTGALQLVENTLGDKYPVLSARLTDIVSPENNGA
jgi:hypothetical protein